MSNRQARREANRRSRSKAAGQRSSGPGGPPGNGWGPLEFIKSPFVIGAAALAVALFGIVIFLSVTSEDEAVVTADALAIAHENFPSELADGFAVGDPDAPIQLEMYEDFQCPFCLRYSIEDEPTIMEEYVKTGKVRMIFRNLPILGTESVLAAVGGLCAAQQDAFWDYQNALFSLQAAAGQGTAERLNVGRFTESALSDIAVDLGMERAEFESCQADPATLELVLEDQATATSLGLQGTPSFVFNGVPGAGASGPQGWIDLLDSLLEALGESDQPAATEAPSGDSGPAAPTVDPSAPTAEPTEDVGPTAPTVEPTAE